MADGLPLAIVVERNALFQGTVIPFRLEPFLFEYSNDVAAFSFKSALL